MGEILKTGTFSCRVGKEEDPGGLFFPEVDIDDAHLLCLKKYMHENRG
jgi:hypothetical protein